MKDVLTMPATTTTDVADPEKTTPKKDTTRAALPGEPTCQFPDCGRIVQGLGYCWAHYRQHTRHTPLRPVRDRKGWVLLPSAVRVPVWIREVLEKRVESHLSASVYEATRHAIEAGIHSWGIKPPKKTKK